MFTASLLLVLAASDPIAAPSAEATPPAAEPKICKRFVDTGSHIAGRMVCMTKKQWERRSRATQDEFDANAFGRR